MKHAVGKVPQQLPRPRVVLLPDKPSERSHPGVDISWAKKTPRVDILQYFLELRIQNCEELDSWVLIYQGPDKKFTCTRLPRGAKYLNFFFFFFFCYSFWFANFFVIF